MTVSAINDASLLDPTQNANAASWQMRMQQSMAPVAQLFGETPQQLMSDLQSGKTSLSALAQSKGISQTDLLDAIKQGLQQSSANGGPQLSDNQLTNLSSTIANRVHGHHHHHHGGVSAISNASTSGTSGVTGDADGDNDGSAGSVAGASSSTSSLQADVERLMFELQTMLQSSSTNATAPSTTTAAGAWSDTASATLLTQVSQFDQTL
jgi:hypothetical protein